MGDEAFKSFLKSAHDDSPAATEERERESHAGSVGRRRHTDILGTEADEKPWHSKGREDAVDEARVQLARRTQACRGGRGAGGICGG
jgi:hypothetical protein